MPYNNPLCRFIWKTIKGLGNISSIWYADLVIFVRKTPAGKLFPEVLKGRYRLRFKGLKCLLTHMCNEFFLSHFVISINISISESGNFGHKIRAILDPIDIEKFVPRKASITVHINKIKKTWPISFPIEVGNSDFWSCWFFYRFLFVVNILMFSMENCRQNGLLVPDERFTHSCKKQILVWSLYHLYRCQHPETQSLSSSNPCNLKFLRHLRILAM